MNPEADPEWSKTEEVKVKIGQEFFVNDYVAQLEDIKRIDQIQGIELSSTDAAVEATIKIQGNTVVVFSKDIKEPVAVRFGFSNTAMPNLFTVEGLPVNLFRTDDWEVNTNPVKK